MPWTLSPDAKREFGPTASLEGMYMLPGGVFLDGKVPGSQAVFLVGRCCRAGCICLQTLLALVMWTVCPDAKRKFGPTAGFYVHELFSKYVSLGS